ncbi:ComF family protein [Alteromonas sp. D210916BOD_24]|uniref:ComF family protein n=1 Tax=Alteromonas sp. D210916BOD_24 TaxID=3157618 RepID=UPI00399CCE0E
MFFFNSLLHGDNLLQYGPVGRHVKHNHFDALSILGLHVWPMSTLIHQFKFTHSLTAGKVLSDWFVHKKRHCTLSVPDLLLPVPISAWRIATRQYNQTSVLCHHLSSAMKIPYINSWAIRKGLTTQHRLTKSARAKNAKQVFSLSQGAIDKAYSMHNTRSQPYCVAIVDDVITTGVTANTLAQMLKTRYRHIEIQIWAMAFTPPPKSTLLKG